MKFAIWGVYNKFFYHFQFNMIRNSSVSILTGLPGYDSWQKHGISIRHYCVRTGSAVHPSYSADIVDFFLFPRN